MKWSFAIGTLACHHYPSELSDIAVPIVTTRGFSHRKTAAVQHCWWCYVGKCSDCTLSTTCLFSVGLWAETLRMRLQAYHMTNKYLPSKSILAFGSVAAWTYVAT